MDPGRLATRLESLAERVPWRTWSWDPVPVLVAMVAVAAAILVGPILGGDDVWVRALADGSYTGEPTERLIFMSSVLGWLLRAAYTLVPEVGWYAVLLYLLLGTVIATTAWVARRQGPPAGLALTAIGVYFLARPMVMLSWTETGLLVAGAGVLLACCGPATRRVAVAAGLLVALGYLVRMESLGIGLAAVPLLVMTRHRWRHFLVVGLVAVAVIGPAHAYDRFHYLSDEEWRDWFEFEQVRRDLHETPALADGDGLQEALDAAAWSRNDLAVFTNWYYVDEEVFSGEALADFQEARGVATIKSPWISFLEIVQRQFLTVAVIGLGLALAGARRWLPVVASVGWLLAVFSFMDVLYRTRPRIEAVIIAAVAAGLVLLLRTDEQRPRPFVVIATVALLTRAVLALVAATDSLQAQRDQEMAVLEELGQGRTYVQVAGALELRGVNAFESQVATVPLVMTGWTVRTPHFDEHLELRGLEDPVLGPVVDDAFLMVGTNNDVASIVQFVEEHHGIEVDVERVGRVEGSTLVWDLSDGGPVAESAAGSDSQ